MTNDPASDDRKAENPYAPPEHWENLPNTDAPFWNNVSITIAALDTLLFFYLCMTVGLFSLIWGISASCAFAFTASHFRKRQQRERPMSRAAQAIMLVALSIGLPLATGIALVVLCIGVNGWLQL